MQARANEERLSRIKRMKARKIPYYTTSPIEIEYLLGKIISKGALLIGGGCGALFVDGRYTDECADAPEVEVLDETFKTRQLYLQSHHFQHVAYDPSRLPLVDYREMEEFLKEEASPITEMRQIKDEHELKLIRGAAALNLETYHYLRNQLRVGMSEREAAWIFEKYAREQGAESMAFGPIVAFGANTALPHHRPGETKLEKNMAVLLDMGVTKDRYASDMTRSFWYEGEDAEYERLHHLVVQVQREGEEMAKPGISVSAIDQHIRDRFFEEGLLEAFKHTTGHALGLEVHEPPRISHKIPSEIVLKEGMVITIEPGLYFAGKWGIRHENTLIIDAEGGKSVY